MKEFIVTITLLLLLGTAAQSRWLPIPYEPPHAENHSNISRSLDATHDGVTSGVARLETNSPLANDNISPATDEDRTSLSSRLAPQTVAHSNSAHPHGE